MAREQRRLAAIVAADVVGYSRLMGRDEAGTLAALKGLRKNVVDPAIAAHNGRLVKTTGDGLLLEFASVVEALRCVIEVQTEIATRRADMASDQPITLRMGVNLGDVIVEGDDILGDGVNVAARLQELAPPGGVAVSGRVHDDVIDRLEAHFEDLGPQILKNIARPVPVWRWSPNVGSSAARHRRAAVVITDVARFSTLMKLDAATTLATLTSLRREIIDPLTRRYRGRLVKPLGDGEMLEFPDAASAVGFVLKMQKAVALRSAAAPVERRLVYRVGVGLGDVFVLEGDLLGEGVMIAHRLAGLAEPGSACVSDAVHREVHGKIDAELVALGERQLNGVERPVVVWGLQAAKASAQGNLPRT